MNDKEILANLKGRLFSEHGTNEVKLKKPVRTGTQDWRAGGGDPTCTKVRAKSETEFEWYLNDWAYGWYGEDDYSNGVETKNKNGEYGHLDDDLKIKILTQALGVSKKSVKEETTDVLPYEDAKKAYELLHEERDSNKWELAIKQGLVPEDDFYIENPATYELWKFRKSDKTVPYKVLYGVVEELLARIDHAESSARYAGWRE